MRLDLGAGVPLLALAALVCWQPPAAARAADWDPIDPAQLAASKPAVDANADVEALSWDVWVEDRVQGGSEPQTHFKHSLRLKIYNERGVESAKQVEIPFDDDTFISDVAARTVRPDGSVVELKRDDVFERTLLKASGVKVKAKSFAVPGLVPGAVVDYSWVEHRINRLANYVRLDLQRDVPVQRIRHHIKPLALLRELGYSMAIRWFHHPPTRGTQDRRGFTIFEYRNLPAFREEPAMPPEYMLRSWVLIYYTKDPDAEPAKYWQRYARDMFDELKPSRRPARSVAELAGATVTGTTTVEEKVARLVTACQQKVRRVDLDSSGLTPEERRKLKENKSSEDTLEHGYGTGGDLLRLFVDLARAAGLDARVAALPDASFHTFEGNFPDDYFLRSRNVAVRNGSGWLFCDPSRVDLPPGMLRWQEEGQPALIADPDQILLIPTPASEPKASLAKREARLRLSEDGALEGDVSELFTGHLAGRFRGVRDSRSEAERAEDLKQEVRERLPGAELSAITFENTQEAQLPFVRRYHVRIPDYGQRTGKRIFFSPSFFEANGKSLFTAAARQYPVMFHHAWAEEDQVVVEMPPGFVLEQASLPAPISSEPVAAYQATARVAGAALEFQRQFHFGGGGSLYFPAEAYPQVKRFFDAVHDNDNHALALVLAAPAAAEP